MASRKSLASSINSLLVSIDLEAPVLDASKAPAKAPALPLPPSVQMHITDIIGNLSLDLN
jgi:hypothetical protein